MAFQNILFPNPKLIHGIRKEVIQQTNIITNGITEYRISKTDDQRSRWTWPARAMSADDQAAIIDFSKTVNMSLDSFRFYCPFEQEEFAVRFDMSSISYSAEVLDSTNAVRYVNMSDITLIQVFNEND